MPTKDRGRDYLSLLTDYPGEEKFKERVALLIDKALTYINNRNLNQYVTLQDHLIIEAVIDYFCDIGRLKQFHEIEATNPIKVAAYTSFWVLRKKPLNISVQLSKDILKAKPELNDINEWFAFSLIYSMAFDTGKMLLTDAEKINQFGVFNDNLSYFLTYRILTPQALELILLSLNVSPCYAPLISKET